MTNLNAARQKWTRLLLNPGWYMTIVPEIDAIRKEYESKSEAEQDAIKKGLYDFFELHLRDDSIALEKNPPDADLERKPVDTLVIHHTSNPAGMSKDRLSGIELMRLYAPYFYNPKSEADKHMKGRPIYSGHARNGRQVFWPYHWLVRKDGAVERLLEDGEIGWHSGNWDVNCRSAAICLDGDYENSEPSGAELRAIAELIKEHYPQVAKERILGHCEVIAKTACPSNLFVDGWKRNLIALL